MIRFSGVVILIEYRMENELVVSISTTLCNNKNL